MNGYKFYENILKTSGVPHRYRYQTQDEQNLNNRMNESL